MEEIIRREHREAARSELPPPFPVLLSHPKATTCLGLHEPLGEILP